MPISRRSLVATLAATPLVSLLPRPAFAAYPDHPIRLIVPFAAGGNADFVARLCAEGMAVHKELGVNSVKELVDYVKKNPGLGFATSGVGSNQHVVGEWFAKETGLKMEHVPYRGAGQAINDLVAAHVKMA